MSLTQTAANIHSQILAQVPGQDLNPQAPGDFGEKVDRGLNFGVYIGPVSYTHLTLPTIYSV